MDKTAVTPKFDLYKVLHEEGLVSLGRRYGKAGDFWGLEGNSRVLSVGKRDIMVNVYLIGIHSDGMLRRPDERWTMYVSELISKMDEVKFRKWAKFVKEGMTKNQLRDLTRALYQKKREAGAPDPLEILDGRTGKNAANPELWTVKQVGGNFKLVYQGASPAPAPMPATPVAAQLIHLARKITSAVALPDTARNVPRELMRLLKAYVQYRDEGNTASAVGTLDGIGSHLRTLAPFISDPTLNRQVEAAASYCGYAKKKWDEFYSFYGKKPQQHFLETTVKDTLTAVRE